MDETVSIDYLTREAAEEALRLALIEQGGGLEASIESHGAKWRLVLHMNESAGDDDDDMWTVTRLETF